MEKVRFSNKKTMEVWDKVGLKLSERGNYDFDLEICFRGKCPHCGQKIVESLHDVQISPTDNRDQVVRKLERFVEHIRANF